MKTSSPADPPSLSIGFRDPIWALVFIAHLILVGIAAGISCSRFDWDQIRPLSRDTVVMLWTLAGSIVTSVAFSYGWLRFLCLPSIRAKVLPTAMTVYASLMVVTSIAWFCYGNWIAGVCFLGSSCLLLVWYYFIRHRVAFNSVLLEMATATVQQHRAIVAVAIVAQLLSFVWVGIWAMAVIGLNLDETSSRVFVLFLIISFYWTGYVLLTFVHVSVGGVAASWFLQAQADGVVRASVRRAGTTSFGSICLGSLILAVVEALRALANSSSQEDNAVRVIAHCILSLIQFVAEFVTNYAYAYVAIWGHDFCTASKQTWQLLKTSGFDTLVTYNLSSLVVLFSGLVGGAIGALLSGLLALAWQAEAKFALATACAGGFMTLLCTAEIMQVLTSCITIFFVLWAENPRALARNHPDVHQKLGAAALKLQPQFSGNL